ncbi:endoplasmic reticulum protein [Coprinellus micaceus]|uniref:ER membrane protein complex subunit 4 n=1 Tax=Coprinellus micaceus TaxID=71717 RepID=A0A4Y7TQ74_COPMI|nr:endoplasmic reticulum protein [Coprinellus micaceus]
MSRVLEYSSLESSAKWSKLPPPPGFSVQPSASKSSGKKPIAATKTKDSFDGIKEKRAWDFATSPAKQLPMQAFMLYMSGGGVQIFSMGIVFMLLMTPFKNIFAMNEAFAQFAPSSSKDPKATSTLIVQKLLYVVCNLLTLGVGLWKCRSMGLLPTGSGDWLAFETRGPAPEIALY